MPFPLKNLNILIISFISAPKSRQGNGLCRRVEEKIREIKEHQETDNSYVKSFREWIGNDIG